MKVAVKKALAEERSSVVVTKYLWISQKGDDRLGTGGFLHPFKSMKRALQFAAKETKYFFIVLSIEQQEQKLRKKMLFPQFPPHRPRTRQQWKRFNANCCIGPKLK